MDYQNLVNLLFGLIMGLGSFIVKNIYDIVKELQLSDKKISEKLEGISVLVAGQYVTRADYQRTVEALFKKLDNIAERLDSKADRPQAPRRGRQG